MKPLPAWTPGCLLALATACGASSSPSASPPPSAVVAASAPPPVVSSAPPAPAGRTLEHDETVSLGTDTQFTAPSGWSLVLDGARATLTSPEHDLTLTLAVADGSDVDAVIRDAWRARDPEFAREVQHRSTPPSRDGWDETVQIEYRTAPSESRAVIAAARRKGAHWYLALIDGSLSGFGRRGSQVQTSIQTFRAPGTGEENWAGRTLHALDAERTAALEQFVAHVVETEHLPGLALGIIQGDRLAYAHGFGVRAVGGHDAVTPRTTFMIGSATKPFTSLLLARMVEAHRFAWDTPVVQVMPSFHLGDASVTPRVQIQHTVCACTGMPRRDLEFIFEYAHATPEHWLDVLGSTTPTSGFGEVFQYSNLLVAAGGFVAARVLHPHGDLAAAVRSAMHDEVFGPLGMRSTTLLAREAHERAEPHGRTYRDEIVRIPLTMEAGVESVGPAGAAWSNIEDMSRYVLMELRRGALDGGRRFLTEATLLERRRPRIRIDEHRSYGLALVVGDAHGVATIGHGGATLGFSSDVDIYPDLGFGMVVLSNTAGAHPAIGVIERKILELLLDARPEAETRLAFHRTDVEHRVAEEISRIDPTPPRSWYETLLGHYHNDSLGDLTLAERGQQVVLDVGEWSARVGRERHPGGADTLMLLDPPLAGVDLQTPTEASPGLLLDVPQMPYRFARRP